MRCAVCGHTTTHDETGRCLDWDDNGLVQCECTTFDAAIPASKVRALAEKWKNTPGWRGLGEALEAHLLRESEGGAK